MQRIYIEKTPVTVLFLSKDSEPDLYLPQTMKDFERGIFTTSGLLMSSYSMERNELLFSVQAIKPNVIKKGKLR